jgi:hypothetical protein
MLASNGLVAENSHRFKLQTLLVRVCRNGLFVLPTSDSYQKAIPSTLVPVPSVYRTVHSRWEIVPVHVPALEENAPSFCLEWVRSFRLDPSQNTELVIVQFQAIPFG